MCMNTLPTESTFTRYVRLNGEASSAFLNYFDVLNHGTPEQAAKARDEWEQIEAEVTKLRRQVDATESTT